MNILKRDDLSSMQKLIYAIIAMKQGESDFAKLTNIMIADAVGCTPRYVSESITKMENLKLLVRVVKGKIHVIPPKGQYGMVELDMLITTNISARAKYLYLIYCATGNDYDANIWGRKRVCSDYHISHSTYYLAHKELEEKKILEVIHRASNYGIQTSNINIIIRTDKWAIKRPPSWIPSEGFDLDKWCLKNFDEEGRVQAEDADIKLENDAEDASEEDEGMQRTLTVNSNHNSTAISSNLKHTNGNLEIPSSEPVVDLLNLDLMQELMLAKLRSPKGALKVIDKLKQIGHGAMLHNSLDEDIIERAFVAFEYFKSAVERYDQDTTEYALNIKDLYKFCDSAFSFGSYADEEMEYHIQRVTELGFDKQKKPYIGFSYVINTYHGVKQPSH